MKTRQGSASAVYGIPAQGSAASAEEAKKDDDPQAVVVGAAGRTATIATAIATSKNQEDQNPKEGIPASALTSTSAVSSC